MGVTGGRKTDSAINTLSLIHDKSLQLGKIAMAILSFLFYELNVKEVCKLKQFVGGDRWLTLD
jgi:hypothetical protein